MADKEFYTTFEVGEYCSVYHTTVINWVNKGQLKAYVTPGGHRRIQKPDLLNFMRTFGIPIPPELFSSRKTILAVDDDPAVIHLLEKAFSRFQNEIQFEFTHSGVEALVRIGKRLPHLIILDVVMPEVDGIQVCRSLKSGPETRGIGIISISGEPLSPEQENYLRANVDAFFRKPFSIGEMVRKSFEVLGLEERVYEAKTG